jgi:hypothetical protein
MFVSAKNKITLNEFVRFVDELKSSRFGREFLSGASVTVRSQGNGPGSIVNFDEDYCRSFILGCRMLVQERDGIAIRQIWELFSQDLNEAPWFPRINGPYFRISDYLAQKALVRTPGGETVTNQEVLDVFFYGFYAHRNTDKKIRFQAWERGGIKFLHIKMSFLVSLQVLLRSSAEMAEVARDLLNIERFESGTA